MHFLVDACVILDLALPVRPRHGEALAFFQALAERHGECYVPAHAHFEYAAALITYMKRQPGLIDPATYVRPVAPPVALTILPVTADLVNVLIGVPMPDLKSADMIYFAFGKARGLPLVTEDEHLARQCNAFGVTAYSTRAATALLGPS
jgi:predicted nucleic acid-binding protein